MSEKKSKYSRTITKRFHDSEIEVLSELRDVREIEFWEGNLRTLLNFKEFSEENDSAPNNSNVRELTYYLAGDAKLKIPALAASIRHNGVKVPLTISSKGKLLDGNRRYFACKYLQFEAERRGEEIPDVIKQVEVHVVDEKDLNRDPELERKILAEANFIPDHRVDWPVRVKALVIRDRVSELKKEGESQDEALTRAAKEYGISSGKAKEYFGAMELVEDFIEKATWIEEATERERIAQDKFTYFWEYFSKSKGEEIEEKDKLVEKFYFALSHSLITNIKQVEPVIWAWKEGSYKDLFEPNLKKEAVKVLDVEFKESKLSRNLLDRAKRVFGWLQQLNDGGLEITEKSREWLIKISDEIKRLLG